MGAQEIHGNQIPHSVVAARTNGRTFRYVLQDHTPALFLKGQVSAFLYDYGWGKKGRSMLVRLLDGNGRFAWAARYDGVQKLTVRARPDLVRCGPIWNGEGRIFPAGAADGPPCPVETGRDVIGVRTVLR